MKPPTNVVIFDQNLRNILVVSFAHALEAFSHFPIDQLLSFGNFIHAIGGASLIGRRANSEERPSVCF